jgi:transcriptional regulator with XRE-family HTH domain
MPNEQLRSAMAAAGVDYADIARELGVDPKTVERWVEGGRVPYDRHRRALAALLDEGERSLWPELPSRQRVTPTREAELLSAELEDARAALAAARAERVRYEDALWNLAVRSWRPVIVRRRTIEYEIGETSEDDRTTETFLMAAADGAQPVLWYLISVGSSGEGVPLKSSSRQLEMLEAFEELSDTERRPLSIVHLGNAQGRVWALTMFSREITSAEPRRWSIRESWEGLWNPLRENGIDHAVLDLVEERTVISERIDVSFVFPRTARRPMVEGRIGTPELPVKSAATADGRQVLTITLRKPSARRYAWTLSATFNDTDYHGKDEHPAARL